MGALTHTRSRINRNSCKISRQNLDKGFDPDDPAVKGIEDWDCSNNLDAMDPSLDNLVRVTAKTIGQIFDTFLYCFFAEGEEQKAEEQHVQEDEQVGGEEELVGDGAHRGGGEEGGG